MNMIVVVVMMVVIVVVVLAAAAAACGDDRPWFGWNVWTESFVVPLARKEPASSVRIEQATTNGSVSSEASW